MLRFLEGDFGEDEKFKLNETSIVLDERIWEKCKSVFEKCDWHQDGMIDLVPIKDEDGTLLTYGYQDGEANRELRMLKELRGNGNLLQFSDIFPEYKEVILYGCNELAVSFAEYLKECNVSVSAKGKYWEYFGYKSNFEIEQVTSESLAVYTGGYIEGGNVFQKVKRSVSPEFECIDKIYEANVLNGKIEDTIGDFDELIRFLKDKREIVILGVDREAQDTYDLLNFPTSKSGVEA